MNGPKRLLFRLASQSLRKINQSNVQPKNKILKKQTGPQERGTEELSFESGYTLEYSSTTIKTSHDMTLGFGSGSTKRKLSN